MDPFALEGEKIDAAKRQSAEAMHAEIMELRTYMQEMQE